MAGNKLSPRQKMIGMMYLVLIALLALNVSKTVLDAFSKINESLYSTTINFSNKNNEVYTQFEQAAQTNPGKAGPWRDKAMTVKKEADALVENLQRLKFKLVAKGDKVVFLENNGNVVEIPESTSFEDLGDNKYSQFVEIKNKKDRYESWNLMHNEDKEGEPLVNSINTFKNLLLSYTESNNSITNSLNSTFDLSDVKVKKSSGKISWLRNNFEDMPLIAAVTILSKIQTDVRNAEADVINYLKQEIDATSLKFTSAEAIQIAPSNYIFLGDTFKADVFIAAKDSIQNPVILLGDYELGEDGQYKMVGEYDTIPVKGGKGKYAIKTRTQGYKKWGGLIAMKTDAGTKLYPFNGEYQVAKQTLVVSPTKMNVFYILANYPLPADALGNPVDISVPGISSDKLTAYCDNGKIIKKGGEWQVFPKKAGKANITVSAEIDGKRRNVGKMEFRVKHLPAPEVSIRSLKNGEIRRSILSSNTAKLLAKLEDNDFDAKYTVLSFEMHCYKKGDPWDDASKSNKLTKDMRDVIKTLPLGSQITFKNILAKGPGKKKYRRDLVVTLK
tara:strand:- start:3678 stop:5351 length:1674 start_codon:yes stop_codon:yes gene_type:complete